MFDCRVCTEEDRAQIEQLWAEETDWGPLADRHWKSWYEENPYGRPVAVVMTGANNEIVGQLVFLPSLVSVRGRIVSACRPFAPILQKTLRSFRGTDLQSHPIFRMFHYGLGEMRRRGAKLLYMLPDPRWAPLLRTLSNFRFHSFPLWHFRLPLQEPFAVDAGFSAQPVEQTPAEIDALWRAVSQQHDCLVVRDSNAFAWRIGVDRVMAVTRGQDLAALVVYRYEGKEKRQWVIRDLLSANDESTLRNVLTLACNRAQEEASGILERPLIKIATMVPPAWEEILRDLQFVPDQYTYPLAVLVLDDSIAAEDVAPERWFVTGND